ncbi:MAG: carbohydrate ABC transporter permease [Clostridiales bacterium]|nr:carbohydrate ABC transporter permease [Clostridiales bacterium]MCI7703938.1 carbohydrate ABC transporter permease [Clostridiales bacterium]MDY3831092.1 carbohydrate ABC transporter permease [Candidatus Ventricola sp.]MDY4541597.1 carbohydrate ABC transporter permease [Candidatus Ventricola sp.]
MSENIKAAPQVHNFKKPKSGNQDHSVHQVTVYQVLCVIALIIVALLFTFPLYWIITGSFKGPQAVNARVPVWFPTEPTLLNYEKLFEKPALMWMFNTVFVCALAMLFTCVAASMGGYALAKKRFTGRALIFSIFVCAMALPKQVILIPLLKEMAFLNLHNTLWAVILPTVGWPFGVFLMKQFSENIPSELLEAARIDGAGEVRTFTQIVFPMIKPGIGALAIFTFINTWNDYFLQLIMLNSTEVLTISLGIAKLQSEMSTDYGLIMAGAALGSIPIIAIFLMFQKFFTRGITMGAVKG